MKKVASCIDEPLSIDETTMRHGESFLSWLSRSTLPLAAAIRRFINENIAKFPHAHQDHFCKALHSRWESAFFEFVVARTIQELGGDFEVDVESQDGRRPDFRADFNGKIVTVEATSPHFEKESAKQGKQDDELVNLIKSWAPENMTIYVKELPRIGHNESKSRLKSAFQRIVERVNVGGDTDWSEYKEELPQGRLKLDVFPEKLGDQRVLRSLWYPLDLDAEATITSPLRNKRKKKQVKSANSPVLLAIHGSGLTTTFQNFDHTLFGRPYRLGGIPDQPGIWKGETSTAVAAVLAYKRFRFCERFSSDPVLYIHPRFDGELPPELLALEHRSFDYGSGVVTCNAKRRDIRAGMGYVPEETMPIP